MRELVINIILLSAAVLLLFGLVGCNTTTFTKTAAGDVTIKNTRMFWTTDSYAANWNTNGANLEVNKSGTDSAALASLVSAAVNAAK